jgi:hypothetical protein
MILSDTPETPEAPAPSACWLRLTDALAVTPSLPPITGPGKCGASDVVRLEAVVHGGGNRELGPRRSGTARARTRLAA